jgi:hypothetical protein
VARDRANRTGIDQLFRIYVVAAAGTAAGWVAFAVLRTSGSSTGDASLPDMLFFALALVSTARAAGASSAAESERVQYGEPDEVARQRFDRVRRLFKGLGLGGLVAGVASIVVSWTTPPLPEAVMEDLFIGIVIASVTALVTSRGIRRGWLEVPAKLDIDVKPRNATSAAVDVKALTAQLKHLKAEVRAYEGILRTQRETLRDIHRSIKDDERSTVSWFPQNLRWALVGFGFGIVGNWLTEPLFELLIVPLKA